MKKLFSSIVLASLSLSLLISSSSSAAARANVIITTDGPEAQEITVGSNDVALLNLHIDTNARVNFANFPIRVRMPEDPANTAQGLLNGNQPNLTDIKVINSATGEVLMGPIDSTQLRSTIDNPNTTITDRGGDQIAFFLFEEDFIARIYYPLDLTITADIADNANLDGSNVTMTMRNSAAYPEIRKMSNNAWATLNPRGNIDGAVHQIVAPQPEEPENLNHPIFYLSASSPSGFRTPSFVDRILQIQIQAQERDILFDSMKLDLVTMASFNTTPLEPLECSLYDNNRVFANGYIEFISPSIASVTFDMNEDFIQIDEEYEISRGTYKTISVTCDTLYLFNLTGDDEVLSVSLNLGNENQPGNFHWSFANEAENIINWVQNNYPGSRLEGNTLRY